MATWPTVENLREWVDFGQMPFNGEVPAPTLLATALAAATAQIKPRLDDRLMPDQSGPEDARCPDNIYLAVIMQASRLFIRKDSPLGQVGTGEIIVQVRKTDPDVEALMENEHLPDIIDDTPDPVVT